jgi:hypothetical protein
MDAPTLQHFAGDQLSSTPLEGVAIPRPPAPCWRSCPPAPCWRVSALQRHAGGCLPSSALLEGTLHHRAGGSSTLMAGMPSSTLLEGVCPPAPRRRLRPPAPRWRVPSSILLEGTCPPAPCWRACPPAPCWRVSALQRHATGCALQHLAGGCPPAPCWRALPPSPCWRVSALQHHAGGCPPPAPCWRVPSSALLEGTCPPSPSRRVVALQHPAGGHTLHHPAGGCCLCSNVTNGEVPPAPCWRARPPTPCWMPTLLEGTPSIIMLPTTTSIPF